MGLRSVLGRRPAGRPALARNVRTEPDRARKPGPSRPRHFFHRQLIFAFSLSFLCLAETINVSFENDRSTPTTTTVCWKESSKEPLRTESVRGSGPEAAESLSSFCATDANQSSTASAGSSLPSLLPVRSRLKLSLNVLNFQKRVTLVHPFCHMHYILDNWFSE